MPARKRRRFAEGTTVDVGKSRMEVEGLLRSHGAHQVVIGYDATDIESMYKTGKMPRLLPEG